MSKLNYPEGQSYEPVWKCIYCGDNTSPEKLTKEHIIPKALNGTMTLPKSSCKRCAEITRDFEDFCLNHMFIDARTMLGLKTSKKKRPPLKIWNEDYHGKESWREIGPERHPLIFAGFDIGRPGIIVGRSHNIDPPMTMRIIAPGPAFEKIALLNPGEGVRFKIDTECYAKMLAKIAHSFAVANYRLDDYTYFLHDHILGSKRNIFHYLGNAEFRPNKSTETLHHISSHENGDYIIVYLVPHMKLSLDGVDE